MSFWELRIPSAPETSEGLTNFLLTQTHLALAPHDARLVVKGGAVVLGGMLPGEERQVAVARRPLGLALETTIEINGWASALLRREP